MIDRSSKVRLHLAFTLSPPCPSRPQQPPGLPALQCRRRRGCAAIPPCAGQPWLSAAMLLYPLHYAAVANHPGAFLDHLRCVPSGAPCRCQCTWRFLYWTGALWPALGSRYVLSASGATGPENQQYFGMRVLFTGLSLSSDKAPSLPFCHSLISPAVHLPPALGSNLLAG